MKLIFRTRKISNYYKLLLVTIIIFLTIYWFKVPLASNTLFIVTIFVLISSTFTGSTKSIRNIFLHPLIINSYVSSLLLIVFACIITISQGTDDFNMAILIAKQIPYITCAVIMGAFFSKIMIVEHRYIEIEWFVLAAGSIQGLIVIMAMTNSDVRLLLLQFQGSESTDFLLSEHNHGVRGFALSAQQFFGLSAMLCIQAVLVTSWKISNNISFGFISKLQFLFFGFACIFVGRISGLIYIICFIVLILMSKKKIVNLIILILVLMVLNSFDQYINYESKSFQWAAELLINFLSGEGFSTKSSTELKESMLFPLSLEQLLIGDGRYLNPDNSYYMGTDSGVMRFVLFGGLPFLFLAFFPYLIFILYGMKLKKIEENCKMEILWVIATILLLQVKGEVIIVGTMVNVFFFTYMSFILSTSKSIQFNYDLRKN